MKAQLSIFMDSGAYSLRDQGADSSYLAAYARFIRRHHESIDLYANFHVIGDPDRTRRNQTQLEFQFGIRPVPVVHNGTHPRWLGRYLNAGHGVVALGGLAGKTSRRSCRRWLDQCFKLLTKYPNVKVHGFGISSVEAVNSYPWYSVDTAAWTRRAGDGQIFVPHKKARRFIFDKASRKVQPEQGVDHDTAEWLNSVGVALGTYKPEGGVETPGVITCYHERRGANLRYFEALSRQCGVKFYFSGNATHHDYEPENYLSGEVNVMPSFYAINDVGHQRQRFDHIMKQRKGGN